jgi:hypothetical protein
VTVWRRRDPKRSFEEGFESEHNTGFTKEFFETATDYLKGPWLRHPVLDWIMLDMMISRELCGFGEVIKESYTRNLFSNRSRYFDCNGDLRKMRKSWRNLIYKFFFILLPLGVIYSAFYIGNEKVSDIIAGRGSPIIASCVIAAVAVLSWQILKTGSFYWDRRRWNQMYEVWQLLEGPIVNPHLVREAMIGTRKKGLVWDMPEWSIIDRVIQCDSAVWIVRGGSAP